MEARPGRRLWLALLFAGTLLSGAVAQEPLFPSGGSVLLLAGLAGDLESENQQRSQLLEWLRIIDTTDRKVVVLSDLADLAQTAKTTAVYLPANRINLLSVPTLLPTNAPLTVIIWGHAGRQGNQPVFHVRGPRVTPAELKAVAASFASVPTQWVLLFRGSGLFARAVVGDNVQVLSSDRDGQFNSDPVQMTLLLNLVRSNPQQAFSNLASKLGAETFTWFKERNLARTEEPTLWNGRREPVLLAADARLKAGQNTGITQTSVDSDAEASKTIPPEENAQAAPRIVASRGTPWKDIKPVDPARFPGLDGVILRQTISHVLGSNPALSTEHEQFIQVLNPEGKRLGDFDLSFSPPMENLNLIDCEVLLPDGKVIRLDEEAVREARQQSVGDYSFGNRKVFSVPGVTPGAILHLHYERQWRTFPLPHVSLQVALDGELPILESTVRVSAPRDAAFNFAFENTAPSDPVVNQATYGSTYTWQLKNVPARNNEPLSPPISQPRLLISTFPDWKAFTAWYARIIRMTDEVTPEISRKALELSQGAATDEEKLTLLYNYVTSLRYVAVPLGISSIRPHKAADVLRNQFGDCKDKATLLNALLRSQRIDAHLVLVPRFSQAHDSLPGLSFNHAISKVSLHGQTYWLDTTDDVCRFGLLPPGDSGRKVLVVDESTSSLSQLPGVRPDAHNLKIVGQLDCETLGGPSTASWKATAQGYPDYQLRAAAREKTRGVNTAGGLGTSSPAKLSAQQEGSSRPQDDASSSSQSQNEWLKNSYQSTPLSAEYGLHAGTIRINRQKATPVSALEENFAWEGEGTCIGFTGQAGANWIVHAPFWLPREWDTALQPRSSALYLNQGYPLNLSQTVEIHLPKNSDILCLPVAAESQTKPLSWGLSWSQTNGTILTARFEVRVWSGELSGEETTLFQKQLTELYRQLAATAVIASAKRAESAVK